MKLLILGKLEGYLNEAGKIAHQKGANVTQCETIEQALNYLRKGNGAQLMMVDIKVDIATLVKHLTTERIHIEIVACGIGDCSQDAVKAIEAGAKEYIPLPPDADLIAAILAAATEESHAIIHQDPAMDKTLQLADQIANSDASVLITGESGTGKELMARYIHAKSNRSDQPFISINCAAIPENLLESELFGHEKGAFTGAVARRIGKFEEANGGTLLLDEISEMHPLLQAKLLRAIQEREIDRVGGTKPVKINIRLLATSNRNLEASVKNGDFREDLFFRLNVINICLPSLRERPKDIQPIAEHYAAKYCKENALPYKQIADETLAQMIRHPWPGNIRELENTMHRAVLLSPNNMIEPQAIMLQQNTTTPSEQLFNTAQKVGSIETPAAATEPHQLIGKTVADVEKDLILGTLEHCLGNRTHAATILGISIRTLRNKLKQYSESTEPESLAS